jgi:hypothetical protein
MSDRGCEFEAHNRVERRILMAPLVINGGMFEGEFALGDASVRLVADRAGRIGEDRRAALELVGVGR